MALSLWAMTAVVGPIAGPALGGWITDSYSWSWIFYINIPSGYSPPASRGLFTANVNRPRVKRLSIRSDSSC